MLKGTSQAEAMSKSSKKIKPAALAITNACLNKQLVSSQQKIPQRFLKTSNRSECFHGLSLFQYILY